MMLKLLGEWALDPKDRVTFSVELSLTIGFIIISIFIILLRKKHPQLTKNGWIELIIGSISIILKGLFDGLDTISPSTFAHDVFDSLEAIFMFIGLILFGIGLLRMVQYSVKVWEVR